MSNTLKQPNILCPQKTYFHFSHRNLLRKIDLILPRTCPITSASCASLIFSSSGITLHPVLHLNILVILFHCVRGKIVTVDSAHQFCLRKQSDYLHALLYTTWPEKWPEQEGLLSEKQNKSKLDFRFTMLTQRECSGQMMTSCQDHILTENMWFVWPWTS